MRKHVEESGATGVAAGRGRGSPPGQGVHRRLGVALGSTLQHPRGSDGSPHGTGPPTVVRRVQAILACPVVCPT